MKKRCIVNFANGSWYNKGQDRLVDSLRHFFPQGSVVLFNEFDLIGSPHHLDNPYAFKVYAIAAARKLGYEQVLWVDASGWAVSDISPVFDVIERDGYLFPFSDHLVSDWCNQNARDYFKLIDEEIESMHMYDGCLFGLDFTYLNACAFFDKMSQACEDGAFNGSWDDHRHDMTCGGIIAHRLGMTLQKQPRCLTYNPWGIPNQDVYFVFRGM